MADSKTKFELADSHEAMDLVPNWELEWWHIVLSASILILAIFLGYLFLRKSKIQYPNQSKLLAYQDALSGLEKLDASIGKENVIIVSLVLRQYLAKAMNEPALYETHEEFIGRHDAIKGLSEDLKLEITNYFSKLAAIKYGPDEGAVADVDTLKQGAIKFLERIHTA
ncbi:MAG: hypothetical protein ACK40T_05385 [Akkermansiaceae bacterium]|jgi:hypothetical protein